MKVAKNNNGELISIYTAPKEHNYFCIEKGCELIPKNKKKNNRKRDMHFAHTCACEGNLETYLHKIAKQIIETERKILLPEIGNVIVKDCTTEKYLRNIKPDILVTDITDKQIIVEIYVAHKCDEEKILKIKELNKYSFEIDLSKLDYNSDLETIKHEVLKNLLNKKILHSPEEKGLKVEEVKKNRIGEIIAVVILLFTALFIGKKIERKITRKDYRKKYGK